jgi:hypothetical protein
MPGEMLVMKSDRRFVGVNNALSVKISCPEIRGVIVQSPATAVNGGPVRQMAVRQEMAHRAPQRNAFFIVTLISA